jgi:PAS domain S-box-containing protein
MSQGVIFRDHEDRIVSVNPAAERIFGRKAADLIGKTSAEVHEHALQEDGSRLPEGAFPADVALRTGRPLTGFVMATLNPLEGEHRWLSADAMPIFRPGEQQPYLVYILFEDITGRRRMALELQKAHARLEQEVHERTRELVDANEELSAQIEVRKKAEAALRESEDTFKRLADNAEDLIYIYRLLPERKFEYVSPSATAMTGYTPDEHYANPDLGLQIVHTDDRGKLTDIATGRIDPRQPLTLRWVRKDGRTIWTEQRNIPITDASGRVVALQGIARDITDRIMTEEKLRESEKFLKTIIETEPACVKMLAKDGSVLMMNRAGLDMIDADSFDQVRGKPVYGLILPEHRRKFADLTDSVFAGKSGTLAFEARGFKGRSIWLETHAVPLRDENNAIIAALGITRDITEQRKMETLLREREASLSEAQRLAHIGSWNRDPGTNEVRWSAEIFRILGLDPDRDASSFDTFLAAIHPQDRQGVASALANAPRRKQPYDAEFRIVRPDGAVRHVYAREEAAFDAAGAPISITGTLQDLTEHRRTEEMLPRIAEKVSQKTSDDFFRSVTEFVARELGVEYAMVVERQEATGNMQTVSVYSHGFIAGNFEYAIADTPCQNVIGKTSCFFPDRMQELFPRDSMLRDMGIASYAGIPLFDSGGRPLGGLVTMGCRPLKAADRDRIITLLQIFSGRTAAELERRRSEKALQKSEQRYRQLVESVTSYIYTVTVEQGKAVSTVHGPGCVAVTGYASGEYAADPFLWYRMVHDQDKPLVLKQTEDLLAGRHPGPVEHRVRHKNGAFVWVRSTVVPHADEQGRITSYDGLIVDITAQKRAEEFSRNILETVDEGFLVIGRDYTVLSVNRAYSRLAAMEPQDIIGRKCYEISHKTTRPCFDQGEDCAVRRAFETESPHTAAHLHYNAQGNSLSVETKAFPLRDEAGQVVAAIEIVHNVTDKKRLEDQLRHSQKMEAVGLLAGGISHDFNNILTAIIGYGNLLQMKTPAEDPLRPYIEQILASSARAANLTQGLLAFSRKQVINPLPMNINNAARRFEKLLQRLIGEDIELRADLAPAELTILADSSQMEQVLMNLATNARDAMPRGGTLTVRTEIAVIEDAFRKEHGFGEPGTYACISICDTGTGMDQKTRDHIFEPFFTTKEPGRGTGLGLAIVYGIMKQNSGYVLVDSEPGKGSCFRLYFPIIAAAAETAKTDEQLPPEEGHETILIAEDDDTIRQLTRTMLGEFGYTVIEASDGEEAVARFREHRDAIKLVILDVVMPKMNGKEVQDAIVAIKPDVKTLFISGYSADVIRAKGVTEESQNIILKPVSPMDLLRTVRRILDSGDQARKSVAGQ